MFENKVLRRIFEPNRDKVTEDLRKLNNEELHNLYFSPNIIKMIKSRRLRMARHLARMGEKAIGGKVSSKETTGKTKT
jgi:hypothetical protein